jgi:hypothetical protein
MNNLQKDDLLKIIKEVVFSLKESQLDFLEVLLEHPEPIREGVYDPGILKAVFTAGGPGSGKSHVADVVFGVRDEKGDKLFKKASLVADTGLKYVNSDNLFEQGLAAAGINPKMLGQIAKEDPEMWDFIQDPTDPESIRSVAKRKLSKIRGFYETGRLGMLIDGTGKNYYKVARDKAALESLGYDTHLLYVDTSLEVAIARDAKRGRSLGDRKVSEIWQQVKGNKETLSELFGDQFSVVQNDIYGPPPKEIIKTLNMFVSSPVENLIGQAWIDQELRRKQES